MKVILAQNKGNKGKISCAHNYCELCEKFQEKAKNAKKCKYELLASYHTIRFHPLTTP
jgi:hypothetical protein